jgi:hypothetical protein
MKLSPSSLMKKLISTIRPRLLVPALLLLGLVPTPAATFKLKDGNTIEGEVLNLDARGIVFKKSGGGITPRVDWKLLDEKDFAQEPKYTTFLSSMGATDLQSALQSAQRMKKAADAEMQAKAVEATRQKQLADAQRAKLFKLQARTLSYRVTQVMSQGLLISCYVNPGSASRKSTDGWLSGGTLLLCDYKPSIPPVDGSSIPYMTVWVIGTFEYTTVLGAKRTILRVTADPNVAITYVQ